MLRRFVLCCWFFGFIVFLPLSIYSQENADNENLLEEYLNKKSDFQGLDWKSVCSKPENVKLCTGFNDELHKIKVAEFVLLDEKQKLKSAITDITGHFGNKYMQSLLPDYLEYKKRYSEWEGFPSNYYDMINIFKINPSDFPGAIADYIKSMADGKTTLEAFGGLFLNESQDMEKFKNVMHKTFPSADEKSFNNYMMCFFQGYYEENVVMKNIREIIEKLKYSAENMVDIYTGQLLNLARKNKETQLGGLTSQTFTLIYKENQHPETSDILTEGATYIITASGEASCWSDHTDGVDACYCYGKWRCTTEEYWGIIRIDDKSFKDFDPNIKYLDSHVYTIKIKGFGKKVKVSAYDGGGYDDNRGSFTVTITKE